MSAVLDPAAILQRGGWPRKFSRPGCGLVSRQGFGVRRLHGAAEQQLSGRQASGRKFALSQGFTAFVISREDEWLIRFTARATPRALYFKFQISNFKSQISNLKSQISNLKSQAHGVCLVL